MVNTKRSLPPTTYHLPPKYAQIVLGLPVDKAFTYSIPEPFLPSIREGMRVKVPFGQRDAVGYVVGFLKHTPLAKVKPLKAVLDQEPLLDRQLLQLCRQTADYYCTSWGEVIEAAIPAAIRNRKRAMAKPRLAIPLPEAETGESEKSPALSPQQKRVVSLIKKSIGEKRHAVFLLYGITASGKTEVYLQAIACVLEQGRTGIVLVPEIALTPQTEARFRARFGEKVALLHSRLTAGQRASYWQMIKKGEARVVIGARSAVFAPVKDLGLIVMDEEHETSFKQQDTSPRYHAREVACLRAKLAGATVILGSATPSLESFYQAKQGELKLLSLPERVTKMDLPKVNIVDMRAESAISRTRPNIFSRPLEVRIRQVIEKGEQAMLFLNRRGFSTFINCAKCGYVARCKRCNVSLTYHYATKNLVCHYCGYSTPLPQLCPQCEVSYLRYFGLGTEKVESELHRLFPEARISRIDTDVTKKRQAHAEILGEFQSGKVDILVGTQMIAKGLDFPHVSLVGVVSADTALNLPDFRSGERTFNLLTQVGGRAGRGEQEGQVIIQTYVPEHYAIVASTQCDYYRFYRQEIKSRRALALPPFTHLVNLTLRGRNLKKVQDAAEELSLRLKKSRSAKDIQVIGPTPAVVSRIRGNFRWNVLLKAKTAAESVGLLRKTLWHLNSYRGLPLSVDVDPV